MKSVKFVLLMAGALISQIAMSQTLEKMQWFNEPDQWQIEDGTLVMDVTPQTDYIALRLYGR